MKKYILLVSVFLIFACSLQAQFRFGAGAQLVFDGSVFGVQGKALYNVNETIDGAGTFTLHLEDGVDWTLDLDAHYLLLELGEEIGFKPFVGLSITRFGTFLGSSSDVGLNIGAFFDLLRSGNYQFYVEPKIVVGGVESLVVSGGILF